VLRALLALTRMTRSIRIGRIVFGKVYRHFGGSLEKCVSGGAALPDGMAQDFRAFGLMIMNGYGMTETSPMITYPRLSRYRFGSVGYKLNNTEVKIDDNGEILVRGPHVMQGYYRKPDETAEIMRGGWLHTGDKGRFDRKGFIFITGRIKNIIVLSNGKNINPEELEGTLVRDFALVKEAAVIERNDQLVAIIFPEESEVRERTIINIEETIRWEVIDIYNRSAAHHKKISDVLVVDRELPKTRMGKIRRHELAGFIKADRVRESKAEIPVFDEYRELAHILADISGKDVFPEDHIELDLGLDSLDKVELQVRIEGVLGVEVSNEDLAAHGRVVQLAELIRTCEKKTDQSGQSWADLLQSGKDAPIPRSGFIMNLVVLLGRPWLKLYFRFSVKGLEHIPQGVPLMFAPNHLSHLDGLMLAAAMPPGAQQMLLLCQRP
jgi:long-chain acyl-CoA synthetase